MASRYKTYDSCSSTSSFHSDPSSSVELPTRKPPTTTVTSRAVVKSKPSDFSNPKSKPKSHQLTTMVKKFMEKRSTSSAPASILTAAAKNRVVGTTGLVIPAEVMKGGKKNTALMGLQKKLFSKEKEKKGGGKVKALTEVKGSDNSNTRTLAMVLRSERELLSANKELEIEISELKLMLEDKDREVEKLKDLCLKQREEIKALKSSILFPNSQFQDLLEKQGSELKQAKQLIPSLQKQVSSLTGQLQCLAEDLAEVKADKYRKDRMQRQGSSPRTPTSHHDGAANSLEFSSCDATSLGSPDDMFLKDFNPCLTPYYSTKPKSKEFERMGYDSPSDESVWENNEEISEEPTFSSTLRKISKSSDGYQGTQKGSLKSKNSRRSEESKCRHGKHTPQRLF